MAWIESHQTLRDHPKTRRLARALGCNRAATVGWLHLWWWWALDYADDGSLERFSDADIEDGVGWDGADGALVDGLLRAGFLDDNRCIHDWDDYAGKLVRDRIANRQRMRAARAAHVRTTDDAQDPVVPARAVHVQDTSGARAPATQPDPTGPDHTAPDPTGPDPTKPTLRLVGDGDGDGAGTTERATGWTFHLAALSPSARAVLLAMRDAWGKKQTIRLNPTQVAALDDALAELGEARLVESASWAAGAGLDYGSGALGKMIRAARTKRAQDDDAGDPGPSEQPATLGRAVVDVSDWGASDRVWVQAADWLQRQLSATNYQTFIAPLRARRRGDQLILAAPTPDVLAMVSSRMAGLILRAVRDRDADLSIDWVLGVARDRVSVAQ